MTYLNFHFLFTIPLFIFMVWINRDNKLTFSKTGMAGTWILVFLAMSYTTPWDSYLIREEIWTYSPGNVLGTIYRIPLEEYFFFLIQTLTGCLFTSYLLSKRAQKNLEPFTISGKKLLSLGLSLTVLATLFFTWQSPASWLYFKLIVFWALPIIFLQWSLGWETLYKNRSTLFLGVSLLTLYFWFADSFAIHQQIWTFPEGTISGLELLGILPIEEALFFLVTNLMVVQGYILFTQVDVKNLKFHWGLSS